MALTPLAVMAGRASRILQVLGPNGGVQISGSMWIYLWDMVDEGYDVVLQRLKDNGVTGISLATAYHAGRFLEPHNPKRKVVFLEDGTVYFKPNAAVYKKIKPRVNSLVSSGHHLARAKKSADKFGLTTRAWVVCCHNTPLGMAHPEIACEDAFGDKLFHNLCPSNADVRQYLRSLVKDIAAHGVDAIELEALQFQGFAHGYHHEREGIELNIASKFLLGLCFCPSCIERARSAHVDLVSVRLFTKQLLEAWFSDPSVTASKYPSIERLPNELYGPMLEWRKSVIASLLQELVDNARSTRLRQLVSLDPLARMIVSVDPVSSSKITGGVLALGYVKDGASLREPLGALQSAIGSGKITVGFQVGLPESGGRGEFLGKMSVARTLKIDSFNFYNYGFIPIQNLTWIKDGLR